MSNWIECLPTAQKRCGTHKKYVFVDEDYVYKGPFSANEVALKRAETLPKIIQNLQRVMEIPETHQTSLVPIKRINIDNKIYLQFDNVGHAPSEKDVENVSTKLDTNIKVFKRETYVDRVSEIEKRRILTEKEISIVLQHLYTIYLLNVGDAGTHNMLACRRGPKTLVGIDYEESRGQAQSIKAQTDIFACLFKTSASKLQRRIYESHLKQIKLVDDDTDISSVIADDSHDFTSVLRSNASNFKKLLYKMGVD